MTTRSEKLLALCEAATPELVRQLREQGTDCDWNGVDGGIQLDPVLHGAANEIERLNAEVKRMVELMRQMRDALDSCEDGDCSTGHVIHPYFDLKAVIAALSEFDKWENE